MGISRASKHFRTQLTRICAAGTMTVLDRQVDERGWRVHLLFFGRRPPSRWLKQVNAWASCGDIDSCAADCFFMS